MFWKLVSWKFVSWKFVMWKVHVLKVYVMKVCKLEVCFTAHTHTCFESLCYESLQVPLVLSFRHWSVAVGGLWLVRSHSSCLFETGQPLLVDFDFCFAMIRPPDAVGGLWLVSSHSSCLFWHWSIAVGGLWLVRFQSSCLFLHWSASVGELWLKKKRRVRAQKSKSTNSGWPVSKRQDEWERASQSPPTATDQCQKKTRRVEAHKSKSTKSDFQNVNFSYHKLPTYLTNFHDTNFQNMCVLWSKLSICKLS